MIKILTEMGPTIGYGHISRCQAIYQSSSSRMETELLVYAEDEIEFGQQLYIKKNWISKDFLENYLSNDDFIIIDSYKADFEVLSYISNKVKRVLFIDDNNRMKYPNGVVVHPRFKRANDQGISGLEYIILRSPFDNKKETTVAVTVCNVFISYGGSGLAEREYIFELIEKYNATINFQIVLGANDDLNYYMNNYPKYVFYKSLNSFEMFDLMSKSDLALVSAGQIIYECMSIGIPFIPVKIIDNQMNNILGLQDVNFIKNMIDEAGLTCKKLIHEEFVKMLEYDYRMFKLHKIENLIDGNGKNRIIELLCEE